MAEKLDIEDAMKAAVDAGDQEIIYEAHVDSGYWRTVAVILALTISAIPFMPFILPFVRQFYKSFRVHLTRTAIKIRFGICNLTNMTIPLDQITDITMGASGFDHCYGYSAMQVRLILQTVV